MTRYTSLAAAIVLVCAAPLALAIDAAPANATQSATLGRAAAPATAASLKVDEYKETDVWGRIRSGYAIPDINNSLVERHAKSYSAKPEYMARISGVSGSVAIYRAMTCSPFQPVPANIARLP